MELFRQRSRPARQQPPSLLPPLTIPVTSSNSPIPEVATASQHVDTVPNPRPQLPSRKTMPEPTIHHFLHTSTQTTTYLVADPVTEEVVLIDPVLDLELTFPTSDSFSSPILEVSTKSADLLLRTIESEGYTVIGILESHPHLDRGHASAARYLKRLLGMMQEDAPGICVGGNEAEEKLPRARDTEPSNTVAEQFDRLLADSDMFMIGNLQAMVMHLVGLCLCSDNEPNVYAQVGFVIGANVFISSCDMSDLQASRQQSQPESIEQRMKVRSGWNRILSLPPTFDVYGIRLPKGTGRQDEAPHEDDTITTTTTAAGPYMTIEQLDRDSQPIISDTQTETVFLKQDRPPPPLLQRASGRATSETAQLIVKQCTKEINRRGGTISDSICVVMSLSDVENQATASDTSGSLDVEVQIKLPRWWDGS